MNAYKLTTNISKERKIILDIPLSFPVGPVEIIILYPDIRENTTEDFIQKVCGSLKGSRFTAERHMKLKNEEKEMEG
jgi:hypothetical protein